jgi:hypothetical protein
MTTLLSPRPPILPPEEPRTLRTRLIGGMCLWVAICVWIWWWS